MERKEILKEYEDKLSSQIGVKVEGGAEIDENTNYKVEIYITPVEKAVLMRKALEHNMTIAEFIRFTLVYA